MFLDTTKVSIPSPYDGNTTVLLEKRTLWYLHRNSRSVFTVYYMVRSRLQLHMSKKHMVSYYLLVSYVPWLSNDSLKFFSVHLFCTYIIGVEALSDCSEHIELSVFLMEADHVCQMIRVKSQRPESREDHASFISRRHAARLVSPVESSISLTGNRIPINVYYSFLHISVSLAAVVKQCYTKHGSCGNSLQ